LWIADFGLQIDQATIYYLPEFQQIRIPQSNLLHRFGYEEPFLLATF
jgi:hypothetical protein